MVYCTTIRCKKTAIYNYVGILPPIFCSIHKQDKMINVVNKKCIEPECQTQPSYGRAGEEKSSYCFKHRKEGMVNILNVSKFCIEPECKIRANYNNFGSLKATYCKTHKKENMVDIFKKLCIEDGCDTAPTYNLPNLKAAYCLKHKKVGMVNVKDVNRECHEQDCHIIAIFNVEGEKNGIYCAKHRKDGMINVHDDTCCEPGCKTLPTYNLSTETIPRYCAKHKSVEMVNMKIIICNEDKCGTTAMFGIPGNPAQYCARHRKKGMILNPKKLCINGKCQGIAIFGNVGSSQTHCEEHKEDGEINLIEEECSNCYSLYILNAKKLCPVCDPVGGIKKRLSKQDKVKGYFDTHDHKYTSTDRIIDKGVCIKERPDFLFDCGTHFVIVEVDENQHKDRDAKCEYQRMTTVSQALALPTIFIRYNPDEYKVNGKRTDKHFAVRMMDLSGFLNHYSKINMDELKECGYLSQLFLYYNDYDKSKVKLQIITNFD
jgi:hypothetical protein